METVASTACVKLGALANWSPAQKHSANKQLDLMALPARLHAPRLLTAVGVKLLLKLVKPLHLSALPVGREAVLLMFLNMGTPKKSHASFGFPLTPKVAHHFENPHTTLGPGRGGSP